MQAPEPQWKRLGVQEAVPGAAVWAGTPPGETWTQRVRTLTGRVDGRNIGSNGFGGGISVVNGACVGMCVNRSV